MLEYDKYILISKETWNMLKQDPKYRELIEKIEETEIFDDLSEDGIEDYLMNLESYEDKLAKGEIKWS